MFLSLKKTQINYKRIKRMGNRQLGLLNYSLQYSVKTKGGIIFRNMTVGTFIKKNPVGTFFILVKGHAFTIKDGVVIGNYEDAQKPRRVMLDAFEIK
jgi:hypothetical protein